MGLLRGLFRRREVVGVAREALEFALEASEDAHPNEYMGFLRGTPTEKIDADLARSGYVVTDVLVIPGTSSSPTSATVRSNLVPNDRRTLGSIHSHPNGVLRPSDEDLATFGKGTVHVIAGAPYRESDWRAFDSQGEPRSLEVLDVPLPDPEDFFDFTQADIDEELRR
ncbi:proteasome protein [Halobacteriales archaeon SW_5_70_135]|nr:MAG: proteasome protein [Halobacteriales archaeon SW_5_70_135]